MLQETWPWYVSGPAIALIMATLILLGKRFGMSSNLDTLCSLGGAGKWVDHFKRDTAPDRWNLLVVLGSVIGGFVAARWLAPNPAVDLAPDTVESLRELGFQSAGKAYLPTELYGLEALGDPVVWALLLLGGFLVGFGARYAWGCTSGHAISGLSNLQLPSLIAVIGFFIGGLIMVHLLFPLIFPL